MENDQKKIVPSRRCMICHDAYEPGKEGKKNCPICNECFDRFVGIWLILIGFILFIFSLLLALKLGSLIWLLLCIPSATGVSLGFTILQNF